tara:strand:+ start:196 stop:600 length:405 start_codon:yes stop_codon:yes gene_type:complete
MKTQLLCTFTTKETLNNIVKSISETYTIVFDKVYVLQNENSVDELMCTYNVDTTDKVDFNLIPGTISLHRKKFTNTLYTINALNEVIILLNNGLLDSKYQVPWEDFRNTLMITNSEGLKKIPTRIFKIEKIEKK